MNAWVDVRFEVQRPHDGWRLDSFLAVRLRRYSRTQVQDLIADGRVILRGRPAKPAARLKDGEAVVIRYPRREEPPCAHASLPILYEDDRLLAVNKPGGVLSHPTDKIIENSVTTILRRQFPGLRLHLAHRLDRETSGVLVLAKGAAAARELAEAFAGREVAKEYLAIVAGRVPWKTMTVDEPIGREGGEIKVRQKTGGGSAGQPALTRFERVSSATGHTLVRAFPGTGRLHQIRVHLAHLGFPVVGDKLYIGEGELYMKAVRGELSGEDLGALGAVRQMLHARRIMLKPPAVRSPLAIEAPVPADFEALLYALGISNLMSTSLRSSSDTLNISRGPSPI